MKYLLPIFILTVITLSCSPSYEVVTPFKNLGYSGDRLFPVKTNYSEYSFRIWVSNSTSIDRVISISKDSTGEYQGNLIEYGKIFNGKNYKDFYNDNIIVPKDGFLLFQQKLDSLKLFHLKDKPYIEIVEHQPFSTYVVEIKDKGLSNTFRFDTYYPMDSNQQNQYSVIEKLIFTQFDIKELFKFKRKDG